MRDTIIEESFNLSRRDMHTWNMMYIDDLNIGEVNGLEAAQKHLTEKKEEKHVHARFCENMFNLIHANSKKIGMKINTSKTQLLCMSDSRHSNVTSHIIADGERITSGECMKILGFVFSTKPNVSAHINYCVTKFNRSIWALIHLKRAKISNCILLEIYKVMYRPILEYCSQVYNSMLTEELSSTLERQQKRALKVIYGFETTYEQLLLKTGLETLASRRESAFSVFANKLLESNRFGDLFSINQYPENMASLRNTKKFREEFARTLRLYNSPLYAMRCVPNTE